jgi:hypothetical protein
MRQYLVNASLHQLVAVSGRPIGPLTLGKRGTADDHSAAFVVEDGRCVSARWPGDAYLFSERFMMLL